MQGINIFSGESGLGGALTNPTELARLKGSITDRYSLRYEGRTWPDLETAYEVLKSDNATANDELMVELIAEKFRQHPMLQKEVESRGGAQFLRACSHFTNARSESAKSWEGEGLASRFIRNLVKGFEHSTAAACSAGRQHQLF